MSRSVRARLGLLHDICGVRFIGIPLVLHWLEERGVSLVRISAVLIGLSVLVAGYPNVHLRKVTGELSKRRLCQCSYG